MTDHPGLEGEPGDDFQQRLERYENHMGRFAAAHANAPHGSLLIEMERRDRWPRMMGKYADLLEPPEQQTPASVPG